MPTWTDPATVVDGQVSYGVLVELRNQGQTPGPWAGFHTGRGDTSRGWARVLLGWWMVADWRGSPGPLWNIQGTTSARTGYLELCSGTLV